MLVPAFLLATLASTANCLNLNLVMESAGEIIVIIIDYVPYDVPVDLVRQEDSLPKAMLLQCSGICQIYTTLF